MCVHTVVVAFRQEDNCVHVDMFAVTFGMEVRLRLG